MKRSKMMRQSKKKLVNRLVHLETVVECLQSDNKYMCSLIDELEAEVVETKVKAFDVLVR